MFRRNILALTPAALLAACVTTSGSITTLTLDTAKIDTDGSAIITALGTVLSAPSIMVLLGADLVPAQAALAAAKLALSQFDALTKGSVSISVDTSQAKALITSLIADAQTILSLVQSIMPNVPSGTLLTTIGNYVAAVLTLIPLIQLAIGLASVKPSKPLMSEADALRIANH